MKLTLILSFVFVTGLATAQSKAPVKLVQNAVAGTASVRKAVFTYRGNMATHHDTVLYLRDTLVYKRTYSLIQLTNGEIRQVPTGSIKQLYVPSAAPTMYGGLAQSN